MTDCRDDTAAGIAARLVAEQGQPLVVGDHRFSVTVSVGVACPDAPAQSLESLMQQAATAMNVARQNGRGGWQMFTPTMSVGMRDRWQLENELRTALERRQFVLHYQPQVDLPSNQIIGVEALVRWQNPRFGLVSPGVFIPLAEETGLIEPIGEWVLFEACRQNQRWRSKGLMPVRMSVNVAARQFQRGSLTAMVGRALGEAGLAPECLELEMTESTLIEGSSDTVGILRGLRDQGVSLAIDDFGIGYSSLSYLKSFPLDRLKLDQSFVRDIDFRPDDLAIASAIINLGHTLRLAVIAEGVETVAQLDLLRQHRCDEAQGFHFARALPSADMEVLLSRSALH
jgi:EAL domain-containing protein (putative c-di-GMP-specific phosphodiesterase class I)